MTQEEKGKAYDKVREKIAVRFGTNVAKEIFSEFEESKDERIRKALIEYFNEQCDMSDWNGVYGYQVVSWLEKQGQKLAWSEEDEHRVKDIIYFLDTAKKHYASTVELDACIDWLKSLRTQNTWKPSDAQMQALKEACDKHWEPDGIDPLYTLYEQLKKLKEK